MKKPGGFTANAAILKSDAFKAASPYNAAFAQSMDIVQDFWNVPVYNELIASTAQQLGEALDGKKSSKDALAALAAGAREDPEPGRSGPRPRSYCQVANQHS